MDFLQRERDQYHMDPASRVALHRNDEVSLGHRLVLLRKPPLIRHPHSLTYTLPALRCIWVPHPTPSHDCIAYFVHSLQLEIP